MSAAVRAALAVKRAEHRSRSRSTSPVKPATNAHDVLPNFGTELDPSLSSPFGSPKMKPKSFASDRIQPSVQPDMNQRTEVDIIRASVANGKINLSARAPPLEQVPELVLTLLADEPPKWYDTLPDDERGPWFSREELHTLQLGNNELQQLPEKLCEFQGLKRLELHSNRFTALPSCFFQLTTLTSLTLANNGLTSFPTCLLALDNLVTLNLSSNKLATLWTDADVLSARSERESWDKTHAIEENGIWAGLSPSKKDRKQLLPQAPAHTPLRGLRTLDLSHNRLNNVALGIPASSDFRNAAASDHGRPIRLPAGLKRLDLGHNPLRGPVATPLFANLHALEDLSLQRCGISDNVFMDQDATVLAALNVLDLSGCEVDSLDQLESLFGSRRIKSLEQAMGLREDFDQNAKPNTSTLISRQLVRVLNRPSPTDLAKMEQIIGDKVLCVLLEGNPLREERYRQKRGTRATASPEKSTRKCDPLPPSMVETLPLAPSSVSSRSRQPSSTPPLGLPAKPTVVKEEWEVLAESGLNTELGRRKLRIEQARRAQEEAAAAAANEAETRGRSRAVADLSNENAKLRSPEKEQAGEGQDESTDDNAAGSALGNAKLSTKKKEALGQVPCKFFRSNGCSAGASCPFAHTQPGEVIQKSVCQWFLKGSCRFGHKCALAHVLPGQPMSMDRKNKRAAQHGQPLPQMVHQTPQVLANSQSPTQAHITTTLASAVSSNFNPASANFQPGQSKVPSIQSQEVREQTSQQQRGSTVASLFNARDHDFPFGHPDDLQTATTRPGFESSSNNGATVTPSGDASTAGFRLPSSYQRPSVLSQSYSASFATPSASGMDSAAAAAAFGTSASGRTLGTSPFSHPGGHGLFFSGSQDSEGGAGPFARLSQSQIGARSAKKMDDFSAAKRWSGFGANSSAVQLDNSGDEEIQDAEDFLPSSLSDLLTPVELERRRRNSRQSNSFASADVPIAQSMPSHGPTLFRSVTAPIGAQRVHSKEFASLLQHQRPQSYNQHTPFARNTKSDEIQHAAGLDSIAFRDSGIGFSTSAGRTSVHHAPGQSLPQGLAAGLSQLHLRNGGSEDPVLTAQRGSGAHTSAAQHSTSQSSLSSSALRLPNPNLDEYGLGPTAPSSMLAHRSPLIFAVNGSTFGSPGAGSHAPSPPVAAIGSQRNSNNVGGGETDSGIAIPLSSAPTSRQQGPSRYGNSMQHSYQHSYAQHPGMQRLRAGSSAALTPHSPLSLPVATAEEDEDEAIFELE